MPKHDYAREPYEKLVRDLPDDLAVAIELRIRLHRNGAMSVEGPVADKQFCRKMLDHAWDAINRQQGQETLIVPAQDVEVRA